MEGKRFCFLLSIAFALFGATFLQIPFSYRDRMDCLGTYDEANYNDLYEKVCKVCYEAFKLPVIFKSCIHNCFMNNNFTNCVNFVIAGEEREMYMRKAKKLALGMEGWFPRDY